MLALDHSKPANTGPDKNSGAFGDFRSDYQTGLLHGKVRRRDSVMDEVVHLLQILLVEPLQRIEVFHFGGDACGISSRVEPADCGDTASPFTETFPGFFRAGAQRSNKPNASYNNSFLLQIYNLLELRTSGDAPQCRRERP